MAEMEPLEVRRRVVALGDSITQLGFEAGSGWVGRLAGFYSRKADVLNRGFSGYNSGQARFLLSRLVEAEAWVWRRADLVLVFFGANDAAEPKVSPAQHVPLEQYKANLVGIIRALRQQEVQRMLILAPPPVDKEAWNERARKKGYSEGSRDDELAKRYAMACEQVVEEEAKAFTSIALCNLWEEFHQDQDWKALLSDGLHLSAEGNRRVFESIKAKICARFPDFHPDEITLDAPVYSELDQNNLEQTWASCQNLKASFIQ